MPAQKVDVVIEAVRYSPDGAIHTVRGYVRRTSAFSDRVLISRTELLKKLETGRRVMTGQRIPYMGGCFELERKVFLTRAPEKEAAIATSREAAKDELEGTPLF
jgi:hypothetical protein